MVSANISLAAPRRLPETQPVEDVETSFAVSFFKHKKDIQPRVQTLTLPELKSRLEHPVVRKAKDGNLFSGATFSGPRAKENVVSVGLLVLDYDHGDGVTHEDGCILDPWRELGVRAFAYSTHSHLREVVAVEGKSKGNPNAEPRWRLVIPLREPIPADLYPQLVAWAWSETNGAIDRAARDASHMFYLPAVASEDAPFDFWELKGELLDWRELKLPPAAPEHQVCGDKSGAVEAAALVLKSNAEYPPEKFDMLCETMPSFKSTWERKRRLKDQSASAYDMAIADATAEAGWSDQEMVNAMIHHRRKHGDDPKLNRLDYYQRTIAKAREAHSRSNAMEALYRTDSNSTKEAKWKTISELMGVEIKGIQCHLTDPPTYILQLGNGRTVSLKDHQLTSQKGFARVCFNYTTPHVMPTHFKPAVWPDIRGRMAELIEDFEASSESTDLGSARDWLESYIHESVHAERVDEAQRLALSDGRPGMIDGEVWFTLRGLRRYVQTEFGVNPTIADLSVRLKQIECEAKRKTFRVPDETNPVCRYLWKAPKTLLPEKLAAAAM